MAEGAVRREVQVTIHERPPAPLQAKPARPSLLDEVAALAVSSMRKSTGRMSLGPGVLEERRSCGKRIALLDFGDARPKFHHVHHSFCGFLTGRSPVA